MNFTREPIIETVITPREGCKLVVRSSKGASQEDYFVDAVEVVSFGHSFFFRSQERPKSFLVPVSDYEILETKETRMVLKNVGGDQAIKIGGGRDAPPPPSRPREQQEPDALTDSRPAPDRQQQRPRDGKRRRGRRGRDRHHDQPQEQGPREHAQEPRDAHDAQGHHEPRDQEQRDHEPREHREDHHRERHEHRREERRDSNPAQEGAEPPKAPSFISKLFPPPQTLIKETLSRYKPAEDASEKPLEDQSREQEDDNEE